MTDEEYAKICMTPIKYERFKPLNDSDWACLPGLKTEFGPTLAAV
jgi:hypothetical protein